MISFYDSCEQNMKPAGVMVSFQNFCFIFCFYFCRKTDLIEIIASSINHLAVALKIVPFSTRDIYIYIYIASENADLNSAPCITMVPKLCCG